MFWKKILIVAILTMMVSPALFLTPTKAQQATLTVGWGAALMDTINPTALTIQDGGAYVPMHTMYSTLVQSDANGNPAPDLAYKWNYKDPTTLDLNLVQNATWHDGQPFTADDVVFTINLYTAHKEFTLMNSYVPNIKSVSALDKYTVEFALKQPDAAFVDYRLMSMYILPAHIWQSISNYATYTNPNPIGTGPFIFVNWGGPNTYVQLKANSNYFYTSMRPKVGNLVIRYFTSYNSMALALQSGEIDYGGPLIPPTLIPQLISALGVEVITRPDVRYMHLYFNVYPNGTGNPTVRDRTVRLALAHAVNNSYLAIAALQGYAQPVNVPMPTSLPYWINPSIKAYDFDLNQSARMLDAAGYKVGSDGVRASPSGVKLSYSIVVPSNYAFLFRAAQIVADWWGQIGVRATPQMVDAATISSLEHNWKFDAQMWTWSAGYTVDPDWFVSYLVSSQARPAPNTGSSDSGFMNATFDALYQQQIQQVDPAKRQQIIWQMQQIVHDQVPYVPLFTPLAVQAFRSDRFSGIPNSNLPPLGQFYSNTLFLSLTPMVKSPVTATASATTPTAAATSTSDATGTIAMIAIVVILVVGIGYAVLRKRSAGRK